jgi:hypothetical protein
VGHAVPGQARVLAVLVGYEVRDRLCVGKAGLLGVTPAYLDQSECFL